MKKIIAGLFAIAAFSFSAVAQDQNTEGQKKWNKEGRGHHKGKDGGMRGMEQLNLSDAQKSQIKLINDDFKAKFQALHQNDNLLVKDAKAQKKALMEERKTRISAVLTPAQKTQFEQLRKQHGAKHKGDYKNKTKGDDWKQKRKVEDGKEKIKVKES